MCYLCTRFVPTDRLTNRFSGPATPAAERGVRRLASWWKYGDDTSATTHGRRCGMPSATSGGLGPGDLAPGFDLPAADREGHVSLAEVRRRGPVLLVMLRGLYCPFCRRHISQLRPACDTLKQEGIQLLGIVVASPARARQYFRFRPPCFPMAAA